MLTMTKKESKFLKHIPCSACGSSDANSLYDDGHQYCFNCENFVEGSETVSKPLVIPRLVPKATKPTESVLEASTGMFHAITDRNITVDTCRNYQVKISDDGAKHYYPYGNDAYKVRTVKTKDFHWQGKPELPLFGMDRFTSGGKAVTIVEGELDALAGFQMLGSKYPVLSIKSGASGALKDCKAAYEYLDGFDSIVICFDADEPGLKAAQSVAELFGAKAKVFKHKAEMKDACDYLKANDAAAFVSLWWKSEQYVPDGIVKGTDLHDMVMAPLAKSIADYPYDALNKTTGGIRGQELIVITAGSGLGKSQFLREIIFRLLNTTSDNIGLMFLEESVRKTALSLMSLAANKPLHLAEVDATIEEKELAYKRTVGTGRMFLYDSFGSNSIDNICNRVRYMAKGLDCKYVFLDHISIVISDQSNGDERKSIDEIMTKLRMIVQETGIALFAVSHLKRPEGRGHEEGAATSLAQLRGSGSIGQLADIVLGLERHAQADDPIERNTTKIRTIKNRYSGETGPSGSVLYDKYTGRMTEIVDTL
jgi:twinkle protein